MYYVINGFLLALTAISLRAALFPGRKVTDCRLYFGLKVLAIFSTVIAGLGFSCMAHAPADVSGADYSQVLSLLGVLAAAALIGFFTYKSSGTGAIGQTVASASFMGLFYLLFGAISFYLGMSTSMHQASGMGSLLPFIMWVFLVVNVLLDFADYPAAE